MMVARVLVASVCAVKIGGVLVGSFAFCGDRFLSLGCGGWDQVWHRRGQWRR